MYKWPYLMGNQINCVVDMNRVSGAGQEGVWQYTFIFSGLFFIFSALNTIILMSSLTTL